jgi:predicted DNA-binding WGR domain protein
MTKTRLEFKDSKSHKFWEVEVKGSSVGVHFGKMSAPNGQTSSKELESPEAAKKEMEKMIKAKLKKGYKT